MLANTWEELEFWLDILCATQNAHTELHQVYGHICVRACTHTHTLCMYPSNKIGFIVFLVIFNSTVKLVKDFWPTLYITIGETEREDT
jgi:hypothetical protein